MYAYGRDPVLGKETNTSWLMLLEMRRNSFSMLWTAWATILYVRLETWDS